VAHHETPPGNHVKTSVAAYIGICLAMISVEVALAHRGSAQATPRAKLTDQVMILGTTAALITGVASAALGLGRVEPRWAALLIGVALGLSGVGLRAAAMSTLGRYYSLTPQAEVEQSVVTRGPYGLIRHPGYAGILLSLLGLQMIAGTWVGLLAMLFVLVPLPLRIRIEERLLIEQLGARYEDYEHQTRYRLLPGIY
jgi:protein-S-isoprenylcysteine O-methyltransferase Ste14